MVSSKIHYLAVHFDHPTVTAALVGAGAAPTFWQVNPLQSIYYLLLIPPAAWHLFCVVKNQVLPWIRKLFK